MKIIGHHTCKNLGNKDEIEKPFLSEHVETDSSKHKFLGTGYYFWDNNLSMAHSWGAKRLNKKYYIFECLLDIPSGKFLDLVGNRIDMLWFQEMIKLFMDAEIFKDSWSIGRFLEFLKLKSKDVGKSDIFPYEAIRVLDYTIDTKKKSIFAEDNEAYTNLNPVMIVCLTTLDSGMVQEFRLIREK
mgnify:CR=1 FL=1